MSTIKISQLPLVTTFTANTQNTVFVGVDLDADLTGQFTAQAIARNLYLNNTLIVGNNVVQFDNVIGQFSGSSPTYLQINNQNFNANGSADYVASTSDSDNTFGFIDMGIEGSTYNGVVAGYPAFKPYDGYLYMVGKSINSPTGNLVIGTQNKANTVFINGGVNNNNIVALMTANGLVLNTQSYITFADNTRQITSAASLDYTTTASAVANNASANSIVLQAGLNAANANIAIALAGVAAANANISGGVAAVNANIAFLNAVNLTQNDNISTATTLSQYALGVQATQNTRIQTAQNQANVAGIVANTTAVVANNALANTTGTFAGSLNISNNLTVNGTVVLANSNFLTTEAAFRITASGSSQTPTQAGTLMQLTGKANTPARMLIDSIGISNTAYSLIAGRTARGTIGTPTASQNNDILLRIAGNSYGTTGYAPFGDARIDFVATENRSDANRGSRIRFWNTPIGSNVVNEIASFNGDSVTFTGTVAPTKGFIYTPNIYPSAQTAITVDFANDSVIRAQTSTGLVVTLSNFVVGKSVEAWITNTAGGGQTFTHGCSATNSTVNSTTYSIPATSTIFVKYWCMDGTLANTFVAITHA
jgi:hypothetical protein